MAPNTGRQKNFVIIVVVLATALLLVWLIKSRTNNVSSPIDNTKVQVVTSFYPLYFFASAIGGDFAQVTNITPAGSEPHDYEPNPQNIMQITNSRLLILNGGGLETWGGKVTQIVNPAHTLVVVVGEDILGQSIVDPHIWLAPRLAKIIVEKIKEGYVNADPTNANYYEANAAAVSLKLSDLDSTYQKGLAKCTNRSIVTSHAAFGYLAAAYNLRQIPIAGLSPDSEPSPRQLGDIVQLAKENNVKYIFFENLASSKLSETIAREVGVKTLVLNPLEGLTPSEISQGRDYFTEMKSNLTNLETACGIPAIL
jgi:zinc transport system substrate-binding protein